MYWTDWEEDPKESKRGRIERAWMDGSNRNVFLSSKTVLWPNGLSLDIPQGILYWVDAYYDRIEMVYLNSSERKVSTSSVLSHYSTSGAAEIGFKLDGHRGNEWLPVNVRCPSGKHVLAFITHKLTSSSTLL